jgi:bleomycin hydrolase
MKSQITAALALAFFLLVSITFAQQEKRDKGEFVKPNNEFFNKIRKSADEFIEKPKKEREVFKLDVEGLDLPKSVDEFTKYWFNPPVSQGWTGTCWDFSTTSFFESEVYRIHKKKLKLSEMYTVYWEYVEKAKRYVEERGNSAFGEGSEANAVPRIWEKYGIVPEDDYTGLKPGQEFYDHRQMFAEMNDYLKNVKESNAWNEAEVLNTIKDILNHYMGVPPTTFTIEGKQYTPMQYLDNVVNLNLNDYVDIMSLMEKPYWQKVEYPVEDNWWHSKEYYNVPLDVFMEIIKKAIRDGYTMAIGGDVSEAGMVPDEDVALIPTFDIPSEYIDQYARQFRFSNGTTGDDHGIHLVGYENKDGKDWYLIKDSGSSGHNGHNPGYYFFREDYVKLKMLDFMVNKNALGDLLSKFKSN